MHVVFLTMCLSGLFNFSLVRNLHVSNWFEPRYEETNNSSTPPDRLNDPNSENVLKLSIFSQIFYQHNIE